MNDTIASYAVVCENAIIPQDTNSLFYLLMLLAGFTVFSIRQEIYYTEN